MAASVMSSASLTAAAPMAVERSASVRGLPSLARTSQLKVEASSGQKIKTDKPYGINGGLSLRDGVDASGRKAKGKGVYQFVDKYGANVDGYSPIYSPEEWSPSGDVYVGVRRDWPFGRSLWLVFLREGLFLFTTPALWHNKTNTA